MKRLLSATGMALAMMFSPMAMPSVASAQGMELQIGPDGVQLREGGRREHRRDDRRDHRRDDHRRGRGCSADQARSIARNEGLRRARVTRANDRRIVVEGFTRRGPAQMVFANRRGCPIIR